MDFPVNDLDNPCEQSGSSTLECQNQILKEKVDIVSTSQSLNYTSGRAPGRIVSNTVTIPLSGASVPVPLDRIDLEVLVAGQRVTASFSTASKSEHQLHLGWQRRLRAPVAGRAGDHDSGGLSLSGGLPRYARSIGGNLCANRFRCAVLRGGWRAARWDYLVAGASRHRGPPGCPRLRSRWLESHFPSLLRFNRPRVVPRGRESA